MDRRASEMSADFERFVHVFTDSERFSGPSWYFHRKTLRRRAEHHTASSLLQDDLFFDALYATLTAWGLHRMGPGNTKLRSLDDIRHSMAEQAAALDALYEVDITDVSGADAPDVIERVWAVLTKLRVSLATAQIVANSKALHHLVPALVPPIDREYTFRFFYGRRRLSIDERTAFSEMFARLIRVASANRPLVHRFIDDKWNTSPAKVVDNAVVGYLIAREGVEPPNSIMEVAVPPART